MRIRFLATFGLVASLWSLTGCPGPKPGECKATDDCKGQQDFATSICIEGKCVECGGDADCKAGFVCQAQKCLPKPECARTEDCGTGKICRDQKCETGCVNDGQCGTGKCLSGQCKPQGSCVATTDCTGNMTCKAGICTSDTAGSGGPCHLETVSFGFNESNLTDTAQSQLKANASCISQRRLSVRLEGHADERGTTEFNLQLGEKRAFSVKGYLVKLGVDASKLTTLSYGEEQPANPGHDEAAWAQNRRVEFHER